MLSDDIKAHMAHLANDKEVVKGTAQRALSDVLVLLSDAQCANSNNKHHVVTDHLDRAITKIRNAKDKISTL